MSITPFHPDSIPTALKAPRRWLIWKYSAEQKKLPYQAAHPETEAKVNDPTTWADYDTARAAFEAGHADGVGFVLGEGVAGIDIDDCRNPQTGALKPHARAIVDALDSFTEVSPSGQGIKIYVEAWLGKNHARKGLEVYGARRYFAVTGQHLAGTPETIEPRQDELERLIEQEFGVVADDEDPDDEGTSELDEAPDDDAELIDGGRNNALTRLGGSLRHVGLDDEEILAALLVINRKRCKPALPQRAVESIARSVARYAPAKAERAIDVLNRDHFILREHGKTVVMIERDDEQCQRKRFDRATAADLRLFYANQTVLLKTRAGKRFKRPLADYWLGHPGRRTYSRVVFDPEATPEKYPADVFNFWQGFAVTPKPGSWARLREHIFEVAANRNDAVFRYHEGWLARAVQKPGHPAESALVLRGPQGAGKGLIARSVGHLFGQHFVHVTRVHHLTGHFNAHLQDAIFVFGDEAVWGGDKQNEGALKALITEPTLPIERKGRDTFSVPNVIHLMLATNNEWAVPVGMDDRRFCVTDVSDKWVGNHEYFRQIRHELQNGGYEAMLHDLLNYDLAEFNHRHVPKTAAALDQKIRAMSPLKQWWFTKLRDGRVFPTDETWLHAVPKNWIFDDYLAAVQRTGGHRKSEIEFGMEFSNLFPAASPLGAGKVTVHAAKCNKKPELGDGTKRVRLNSYQFPTLNACRAEFEKQLQQPVEWSADGQLPLLKEAKAA